MGYRGAEKILTVSAIIGSLFAFSVSLYANTSQDLKRAESQLDSLQQQYNDLIKKKNALLTEWQNAKTVTEKNKLKTQYDAADVQSKNIWNNQISPTSQNISTLKIRLGAETTRFQQEDKVKQAKTEAEKKESDWKAYVAKEKEKYAQEAIQATKDKAKLDQTIEKKGSKYISHLNQQQDIQAKLIEDKKKRAELERLKGIGSDGNDAFDIANKAKIRNLEGQLLSDRQVRKLERKDEKLERKLTKDTEGAIAAREKTKAALQQKDKEIENYKNTVPQAEDDFYAAGGAKNRGALRNFKEMSATGDALTAQKNQLAKQNEQVQGRLSSTSMDTKAASSIKTNEPQHVDVSQLLKPKPPSNEKAPEISPFKVVQEQILDDKKDGTLKQNAASTKKTLEKLGVKGEKQQSDFISSTLQESSTTTKTTTVTKPAQANGNSAVTGGLGSTNSVNPSGTATTTASNLRIATTGNAANTGSLPPPPGGVTLPTGGVSNSAFTTTAVNPNYLPQANTPTPPVAKAGNTAGSGVSPSGVYSNGVFTPSFDPNKKGPSPIGSFGYADNLNKNLGSSAPAPSAVVPTSNSNTKYSGRLGELDSQYSNLTAQQKTLESQLNSSVASPEYKAQATKDLEAIKSKKDLIAAESSGMMAATNGSSGNQGNNGGSNVTINLNGQGGNNTGTGNGAPTAKDKNSKIDATPEQCQNVAAAGGDVEACTRAYTHADASNAAATLTTVVGTLATQAQGMATIKQTMNAKSEVDVLKNAAKASEFAGGVATGSAAVNTYMALRGMHRVHRANLAERNLASTPENEAQVAAAKAELKMAKKEANKGIWTSLAKAAELGATAWAAFEQAKLNRLNADELDRCTPKPIVKASPVPGEKVEYAKLPEDCANANGNVWGGWSTPPAPTAILDDSPQMPEVAAVKDSLPGDGDGNTDDLGNLKTPTDTSAPLGLAHQQKSGGGEGGPAGGGAGGGGSGAAATGGDLAGATDSDEAGGQTGVTSTTEGNQYASVGSQVAKSGSGGGSKDKDSGFNFNDLLAQFMPKKEDAEENGGILSMGTRGLASAPAEGSFLDASANIFERIHKTYQEKQSRKFVGME